MTTAEDTRGPDLYEGDHVDNQSDKISSMSQEAGAQLVDIPDNIEIEDGNLLTSEAF